MREAFIAVLGKPEGIILFQLIEATQFTIYLSLIAFAGGGLIGMLITVLRISPAKWAKRIAVSYIWLFQSTPLLMMLFLTGLGFPRLFDININPWTAAVISLIIYSSAYLSDVWRGAVEAIPKGQWEGASALGVPFLVILLKVIVPQAVRVALAPTVGFMVQIIKGTSLAYIIGFHDLMAIGKRWANASVDGSEPYIIFPVMALIYFALCYPLTLWSRHLEKRLGTTKREAVAAAA